MPDRDGADGLLHAYLLDGAGGGMALDWDGVARWKPDDGVLWLHLDYALPEPQRWLGLASGLDPVVREALIEPDPRPRALAYDNGRLFLIVRGINRDREARPEDLVSLRCWFEPHRIVTLRHRSARVLAPIAEALAAGKGPRTGGDFVTSVAEHTLAPVVRFVDHLDDEVAQIEESVLGEHDDAVRAKLADLRRIAIALRRFISPQREAMAKLPQLEVPWLDPEDRARLREVVDRQTRTLEELDAARDRAGVTAEELGSRIADLTNKRLYVLAIITAIFLPLGFVTSLLGVNVGGVPARDVDWAFWVLVGLFAVVVGFQLWWFKKRGWF